MAYKEDGDIIKWVTLSDGRRIPIKRKMIGKFAGRLKDDQKLGKEKEKKTKYDKMENYEIYEEADKLARETSNIDLRDELIKKLDKYDRQAKKGEGYTNKTVEELKALLEKNEMTSMDASESQLKRLNEWKDVSELRDEYEDRILSQMDNQDKWYFGKEAYENYGQAIEDKFGGVEISKRIADADKPNGLRTVAKEVGANDEYDIVEALEGMARNGQAEEIEDGVFRINKSNKMSSLIDNDMTVKELDETAQWLYDNDRNEWNKFTDNELKELAKLTQITKDNPGGRAYDDEVWEEMSKRGLSLDKPITSKAKSFGAKNVKLKGLNSNIDEDYISYIASTTNSTNDSYGYAFNEMLNTADREGLKVKNIDIGANGRNKAKIEFENGVSVDFYDLSNGKAIINNAKTEDFEKIEKVLNTYRVKQKEDVSYDFDKGNWINNNEKTKISGLINDKYDARQFDKKVSKQWNEGWDNYPDMIEKFANDNNITPKEAHEKISKYGEPWTHFNEEGLSDRDREKLVSMGALKGSKTSSKYASAEHIGFGDYNKDGIPVYDNKIDYTGDFSRADVSKLNDKELEEAFNTQYNELQKARSETLGDQRTRNGRMDKIFNTARTQQYEKGFDKLQTEATRRNLDPTYKPKRAFDSYYKKFNEHGDRDTWTGKEYTNDEFMEHLTDANWHQERKMLEEAGLKNSELEYIKDRTSLQKWGVGEELTGKENVNKMISSAKGNTYRTKLKKLSSKSTPDGTYDLDTGESVDFKGKGYNVSFEQSGVKLSDNDYYNKIQETRNITDGKVYGGKFGGDPEMSFYTTNKQTAMKVAKANNQHSIWDVKNGRPILNPDYDERTNKVNYKEPETKDILAEISGGTISTLKREIPQNKASRLKTGTEIYYKGDQANTPGYFTIEKIEPEKEQFMTSITLKEKGGEGRTKKIGAQQIEDSYTNNYASRFSFKEDYDNYRNQVYEKYSQMANNKKSDIDKLNDKILGDNYRGKGETPNLVYTNNGRRIDIDNQGNAIVWKNGKIERKTKVPSNVTGDKVKDYFEKYLDDLDQKSKKEWVDIPGFKDYEYNNATDTVRVKISTLKTLSDLELYFRNQGYSKATALKMAKEEIRKRRK